MLGTAAVMSVDDLLARADSLVGQQVNFQGVCTHTCKHGATKMFMMGSDDTKTIRVEAGKLGAFDTKCINSMVEVTGTLVEQRIDEAYLQNWEAQPRRTETARRDVTQRRRRAAKREILPRSASPTFARR